MTMVEHASHNYSYDRNSDSQKIKVHQLTVGYSKKKSLRIDAHSPRA
jgi:hypothetical protein